MVSENWNHDFVEDELDRRLKAHEPPEPSEDLLDRCLATIGGPRPAVDQVGRGRRPARRRVRIAASALSVAAAVAVACFLLFPKSNGSSNVLAEVIRAFEQAPAYHFTRVSFEPGQKKPSRTKEIWAVRGVGRRMEVREGSKRVGVVVDNLRWRFHWDMDRDYVIAWPSELADPSARDDDAYVFIDRESFVEWGEKRKAEVVPQKDQLDGKEVEKITLQWPAEFEVGTNTVWFDPKTRRPLKKRYQSHDGRITEVVIDYPAPETLPEERFTFQVPRSAVLEVNDPQLSRPLYSDGETGPDLRK